MSQPRNDHAVTTVMVTVVHPADQSASSVVEDFDAMLAHAPDRWGLGKTVASSSVGTASFGEDEIDWRT